MKKEILIHSTVNEVRVAITEDNRLSEYYVELPEKERIVGNIYLGKVSNIAQGINAAFIDIGLQSDAFLHFSDVDESLEGSVFIEEDDDDEPIITNETNTDGSKKEELVEIEPAASTKKTLKKSKKGKNNPNSPKLSNDENIEIALRKNVPSKRNDGSVSAMFTFATKRSGDVQIALEDGQQIIVQVTREAYSSKGVKVSTKIALPGRYLVLLPFDNLIGVSRKISLIQERKRLRHIAKGFDNPGFGCIIRTASKGHSEEELIRDWNSLLKTWREIEAKVKNNSSQVKLLYQDFTLANSIVRDLFNVNVSRVVIDSRKLYQEIIDYLSINSPDFLKRVEYFNDKTPIFDYFGVDKEVANIYRRKVYMKSGASLVLDQTEAMFVIDVNSGRAIDSDQERTAYMINMEAAKEIARQIRLRDIGGIILIDFIDMMQEANKRKIFNEVRDEILKDKTKVIIYPLTQLGLMQITRQRVNQNLAEKISSQCQMCHGTGRVISSSFIIAEIDRWLKTFKATNNEFKLILNVHPDLAKELTEGGFNKIHKLMIKHFVRLKVRQNYNLHVHQFQFFSLRQQRDVTKDYL